jgi:NAD(P)-dependent dehydrogenase (short-subunit alcohol dehydrogenase family)
MNFFITGVSHGFGKELALHFVKLGHCVFGITKSNPNGKDEIIRILLDSKNFKYLKGSINSKDDLNNATDEAIKFMGKIDVLINNAAYKNFNLPNNISDEEYKESVDTNLISPILICQKLIPLFIKQKSGYIINMSSNAGMTSYKEGTAYCSTKAGLIAYSLSLAKYLKDKNISVNVISPPTFTTQDYRIGYPDVNHNKLLKSERVMKIMDYIIFNKKFITGKNFPMFKFKTFAKYVVIKNMEYIDYFLQFRLK